MTSIPDLSLLLFQAINLAKEETIKDKDNEFIITYVAKNIFDYLLISNCKRFKFAISFRSNCIQIIDLNANQYKYDTNCVQSFIKHYDINEYEMTAIEHDIFRFEHNDRIYAILLTTNNTLMHYCIEMWKNET
jgi:hypothetical protein